MGKPKRGKNIGSTPRKKGQTKMGIMGNQIWGFPKGEYLGFWGINTPKSKAKKNIGFTTKQQLAKSLDPGQTRDPH